MEEFIEKLIAMLEENKNAELLREEHADENGMYNDCDEAYEDGQSNGRYQMCVMMLKIVKEFAEEYKGGWIPCNEKQPSEDGYYLITTSDGEIDVREYDYGNGWGWDGFERIIAWQPIQPYKAEEPQWKQAMMNTFLKR